MLNSLGRLEELRTMRDSKDAEVSSQVESRIEQI